MGMKETPLHSEERARKGQVVRGSATRPCAERGPAQHREQDKPREAAGRREAAGPRRLNSCHPNLRQPRTPADAHPAALRHTAGGWVISGQSHSSPDKLRLNPERLSRWSATHRVHLQKSWHHREIPHRSEDGFTYILLTLSSFHSKV